MKSMLCPHIIYNLALVNENSNVCMAMTVQSKDGMKIDGRR